MVNEDGMISHAINDPALPSEQEWTSERRAFVVYCSSGEVALCGAFAPTEPPCTGKSRENYCNGRGEVAGVHECVCIGCALGYDGTSCEIDLNAKPDPTEP